MVYDPDVCENCQQLIVRHTKEEAIGCAICLAESQQITSRNIESLLEKARED